ncbi:MAG: Kelch repeat-containing protein [Candidatus Hodarchaeales archaeon]|jgi:N-acetylneuraminic acid mutarotase
MRNNVKLSSKLIQILLISSIIYSVGVAPFQVTAQESLYSVPNARFSHAMVYDESNQQVILFGGSAANDGSSDLSDTWIFNCTSNTWVELNTAYNPSPRMGHSMVYDSINQQVILFGGWTAETWICDLQSNLWTRVTTIIHPLARRSAGMYFDPVNEKVVLFGGYLNNDSHAGDTWILDPVDYTWTEVFPSFKPVSRYGHSLVYDSVNQQGLLFGGRVTALQSETWAYNYTSNSWTLIQSTQKPKARYWHDAVFDTNEENMVIFGGDDEGPGRSRNDIWMFNPQSNHWAEIFPGSQPIPRSNHAMVYDSLNQRIILFGGLGNDYSDSYSDTWAYDCINSNWIDLIDNSGSNSTPGFELLLVTFAIVTLSIIKLGKMKPSFE